MDAGSSSDASTRAHPAIVGLARGVDRPIDFEGFPDAARRTRRCGALRHGGLQHQWPATESRTGAAIRSTHDVMTMRPWSVHLILVAGLIAAGCVTRVPLDTAPVYPDYPFPAVPSTLSNSPAVSDHERAWFALQAGDLQAAEVRFTAALDRDPAFHPSEAGLGFVRLSRGEAQNAVARFEQALTRAPAYSPALLGRGEALLQVDRVPEAIESFEAAFAADPSLTPVLRRVEALRFSILMEQVVEARAAGAAGRDGEARAAYERLIDESPESGFLYVELAAVEQRQQDYAAALRHLEQAVLLDPNAVAAWLLMADIYLDEGDLDRGEQALLRADAIEPSDEIARALANLEADREARRSEADRPAEYREIEAAPVLTRGLLAALVGMHFDALLAEAAGAGTTIITDARNDPGYEWIIAVVRAGVMEADANYRFQPSRAVTRAEFAGVIVRVRRLSDDRGPSGGSRRPMFSDMPSSHLSYPVAAEAVAAGVLAPLEHNTFQPSRVVTGEEAVSAVERLGRLIGNDR